MNFFYSLFFILGLIASAPYWIWRAWRKRELGLTWARLGFTAWPGFSIRNPKSEVLRSSQKRKRTPAKEDEIRNPILWIHAVSVGEVQAARPLMEAIHRRDPARPLALSVTTRTGMEVARRTQPAAVAGPLPFPLDVPWAVSRRLGELDPAAIIFIDTELWPNLISAAARRNVRLFLANGRISDKSFNRYRAVRFYLKPLFDKFTLLWMQSDLNAERIVALGAPQDRVRVGGNLKIDALMANLGGPATPGAAGSPPTSPLLLAASTHPGEEEIVLAAAKSWKESGHAFRLAIAPRHPERAGDVRRRIESFGFTIRLWSAARTVEGWNGRDPEVLLIDTIGDLGTFFPISEVVFVGGSLVPSGGHNIFEPAAFGRPILFGPHMENFREAEQALSGRGAVRVAQAEAFQREAEALLFDHALAERAGQTARETLDSLKGAADRIAAELLEVL